MGTEKRGGGVGAGVGMRERVLVSVTRGLERSILGVGRWVSRCLVVWNGFPFGWESGGLSQGDGCVSLIAEGR